MQLPFQPPLLPMLCKLAHALPEGDGWLFEPKWDGFRTLAFRDGAEVQLQSRDGKPLARYFPEVVAALQPNVPDRCVLDGEIVIDAGGRLDFPALQLRLHPAASRVKLLSEQTPASFVVWDLLALGDEDLRPLPQRERRARLESALAGARPPIHVTPVTSDRAVAADWFTRFEGAGLDGVIAKPPDLPYLADKRAMVKVKHQRTADCVVAGFRWYKGGHGTLVGSLVLGLYDGDRLQPVGVAASFKATQRAELAKRLEPLREHALEAHPWKKWADWEAAQPERSRQQFNSRWNRDKDLSWEPLRLELVAEVSYDHMEGPRFRHGTHLVRFRPDKQPTACDYQQLEVTPPLELAQILGR